MRSYILKLVSDFYFDFKRKKSDWFFDPENYINANNQLTNANN